MRVPLPTQPPCICSDQVDRHTAWVDFSGWFLISNFLSLRCAFSYKPPMQPNPGSCTHPASAEQRVLLSSQHNVSLQLWKQGWFVVDVVVVVPCDQSRGQGSDVAKSAHHLSVLRLACISFFLNVFSSQNLSLSFVRSLQNQAVPNSLFDLIFSENYHCLSFLFTASQRSVVSHCNSCTQWIT